MLLVHRFYTFPTRRAGIERGTFRISFALWCIRYEIVNHQIGRGLSLVTTTNERPDKIDPRVRSRGYRRRYHDKVFVLIAADSCEGRATVRWQGWRTMGGREDAEGAQGEPFDRGEGEH